MNRSVTSRRLGLIILPLILALVVGPVAQAAAESVTLSGRIFQADGTTPLHGAMVRVTDQDTGQVHVSAATDAAGKYEFTDLPPGNYTFEVEVSDGIFQLDRSVRLGDSDTASISFTVKPQPDIATGKKSGNGMSKKKKGGLIAIIAGGAVLLVVILDDDDDDNNNASPFTP